MARKSSLISSKTLGSTTASSDSLNGMQEVREDEQEPRAMYGYRAGYGAGAVRQQRGGVSRFEGVVSGGREERGREKSHPRPEPESYVLWMSRAVYEDP